MMRVPFFIVLLPVFFALHNLLENYVPVLVGQAFILAIIYSIVALGLTGFSWLLFRDWNRAAILAFIVLTIQFFFGSTHDFLKASIGNSFLVRYSFILPLVCIILVGSIYLLRKTKSKLTRAVQFLNILLIILIVLDLFLLVPKISRQSSNHVDNIEQQSIPCDTCQKPDFYLLVADEYAGDQALDDLFQFDNSSFRNELIARGFHVNDSSISNYNATVYSMASMFNIQYLKNLRSRIVNHPDMLTLQQLIDENFITWYFKKQGYSFYNHSYFNFAGERRLVRNPFYPTKQSLFTAQTLTSRLRMDLGFHVATEEKIESIVYKHRSNNNLTDSMTRHIIKLKNEAPKFVYVHLELPHHPYYYDSSGKALSFEQVRHQNITDKAAYISYLKYSNRVLIELIDHIKKSSLKPPVIMLLSDHGFRQLAPGTDKKYFFSNLSAVHLPSGNYKGFYPGISNVNTMRLVLNNQFGQQFKLLKDSSFLYEEPALSGN